MSLPIPLETESSRPLYLQIADWISARIREGALPAGYRLPPTRALAKELGTHRNTVVRAFEHRGGAGQLESTGGRGTFVSAMAAQEATLEAHAEAAERPPLPWGRLLAKACDSPSLKRYGRLANSMRPHADLIDLQRLQPGADLLPAEELRRCVQHVLSSLGSGSLGYGPREGHPRLLRAISTDLARLAVPAAAEDILVTTGSQQGLDLVARALIDPGDTFLVEESTYSGAIDVLAVAGARVVGVPSDLEGPDMAALERLAAAGAKGFYLMPNGRNPTGTSVSAERRRELVAWSRRIGVPLIEDDYCADLRLDPGRPEASLRALDPDVIHIGSFSKRLIPALRIGYLVCPRALRPNLIALKHACDLSSSLLLQHGLAEFLERGYLRGHLRRVLPEYRARRDALSEGLLEHVPAELLWTRPAQGFNLWLRMPAGLNPELVFNEAQREGVLISPDTLFAVGGRERGIRLTFCAEPPERLREGARRLGVAVRSAMESAATPVGGSASALGVV